MGGSNNIFSQPLDNPIKFFIACHAAYEMHKNEEV